MNCEIWRAICIESSGTSPCQIVENENIDCYIFDSKTHQQRGGTGKTFDWQLIPHHLKPKSMLAGGITPENIPLALAQGCLGLDLNSGLETYPGVKSHQKVVAAFAQLR